MSALVSNCVRIRLPGLVGARRVPELAAKATTKRDSEDADEEGASDGHGRHLLVSLQSRLMSRKNGVEWEERSLVPVLAGEAVGHAHVLMNAADKEERGEASPEHQVDQTAALEHAAEAPQRETCKDGVARDAVDASDLDLVFRLDVMLPHHWARVHVSLR